MSIKDTCKIEADLGAAGKGTIYSLKKLEESGAGKISRLPISIRVVPASSSRSTTSGGARRGESASRNWCQFIF